MQVAPTIGSRVGRMLGIRRKSAFLVATAEIASAAATARVPKNPNIRTATPLKQNVEGPSPDDLAIQVLLDTVRRPQIGRKQLFVRPIMALAQWL